MTMLLDCRARQQQGAENLRLSPPRVVRMEIDHGGLMWSCCHIGRHGNSRSLFRRAAFKQGMRLVLGSCSIMARRDFLDTLPRDH